MINLGCWPIVAVDAQTVVFRQYNPANLVAQSRSGIGQIESKEVDHIIIDDPGGRSVGTSAVAYHLPNIANIFGLFTTVLRAKTGLPLSYLGRVKRLKTADAQPDPPLTLHGHSALLLSRNRTKRLHRDDRHDRVQPQHQRNSLVSIPPKMRQQRQAHGHNRIAFPEGYSGCVWVRLGASGCV